MNILINWALSVVTLPDRKSFAGACFKKFYLYELTSVVTLPDRKSFAGGDEPEGSRRRNLLCRNPSGPEVICRGVVVLSTPLSRLTVVTLPDRKSFAGDFNRGVLACCRAVVTLPDRKSFAGVGYFWENP